MPASLRHLEPEDSRTTAVYFCIQRIAVPPLRQVRSGE
jgi:hypothetical protein